MASLVPFLKKEDLNSMPLGLAMTLSIWPQSTHKNIIKLLAGYILPVLLGKAIACVIEQQIYTVYENASQNTKVYALN